MSVVVCVFVVIHWLPTLTDHLLLLCRRQLWEMANVGHDLPSVFVIIAWFAEGRHSRPADAVFHYPVQLAIGHFLGVRGAKIGGPGIQDPVELGVTAAVIGMANGAVLLVMSSGLDQVNAPCCKGISHVLVALRNGAVVGFHCNAGF